MRLPSITIAIPTFNRAGYIGKAITSALNQTYQGFELLIVDNASTDKTRDVVHSFVDKRIRYIRNKKNVGMLNNWNRCIQLSRGNFLIILGDDDILYPRFLEESLAIHKSVPNLGFTFCHCNKVDVKGNYIMRWGYNFPPRGYIKGEDYLLLTAKWGCNLTNSTTTLIRKEVFNKTGLFCKEFASNTFDFNMWIKIALSFDVYFIDKVLADYRIHQDQVSEMHWRRKECPTGKIGSCLEILKVIAILLDRGRVEDKNRRRLLTTKLSEIMSKLSEYLTDTIPTL